MIAGKLHGGGDYLVDQFGVTRINVSPARRVNINRASNYHHHYSPKRGAGEKRHRKPRSYFNTIVHATARFSPSRIERIVRIKSIFV